MDNPDHSRTAETCSALIVCSVRKHNHLLVYLKDENEFLMKTLLFSLWASSGSIGCPQSSHEPHGRRIHEEFVFRNVVPRIRNDGTRRGNVFSALVFGGEAEFRGEPHYPIDIEIDHSTVTLFAKFLGLSMSRLRNLAQ
jgi:hypothetical protein